MDRVLLIMDDLQYTRQVETTLRKVGFEVESLNNEFSINEPLLSFNPDYIIVRGNSNRLSVLNVGKKLKESGSSNNGKIILVFPENTDLASDELFKVKADLILTDPLSTLRLVLYLISLSDHDMEIVKEKLMKFAVTDSQFRLNEQMLLKNAGITVDGEIETLTNMGAMPKVAQSAAYVPKQMSGGADQSKLIVLKDDREPAYKGPNVQVWKDETEKASNTHVFKGEKKVAKEEPEAATSAEDEKVPEDVKLKLGAEIQEASMELPLRIDAYNRIIKKVDQDLKKGLKKRHAKAEFNKLHKDLLSQKLTDKTSEDELDNERVRFANALFKKK